MENMEIMEHEWEVLMQLEPETIRHLNSSLWHFPEKEIEEIIIMAEVKKFMAAFAKAREMQEAEIFIH